MRAQYRKDYRTCILCSETTTKAVVVTGPNGTSHAICPDCYEAMTRTVERERRKEERKTSLFEQR